MRKKILVSLLSICALGTALIAGGLVKSDFTDAPIAVYAEGVQANALIADKYVLGETLTLPTNALLEYEGRTYSATVTLRDPDGRGYSGEQAVLGVAGRYTIEYKAVLEDGRVLKETQAFDCYDTLYSVNGNSSSVSYGVFEEYAHAESGLAVDLFAGETLTVNKMMDVSGLAYDGGAFQDIISLYVTPYTLYSEDVSQLRFTLTDAYNAENQVTIVLKK